MTGFYQFDLRKQKPSPWFAKEADFHRWLVSDERRCYAFGLSSVLLSQTAYPDLLANNEDGDLLRVELEYKAKTFCAHRNESSMCDLVIAFVRGPHEAKMYGVPVRSLYVQVSRHRVVASSEWERIRELPSLDAPKVLRDRIANIDSQIEALQSERTKLFHFTKTANQKQAKLIDLMRRVKRLELELAEQLSD